MVWPVAIALGLVIGGAVLWRMESWRWSTPSAHDRPAASAEDAARRGGPAPTAESTDAFRYMLGLRGRQITRDLAEWLVAVADGHPRPGTRRQALQSMGWALYDGPDGVWAAPATGEVKERLEARIIAALDDPDPTIKVSALSAVVDARLTGDARVAAAMARLLRDPDPRVRAASRQLAEPAVGRENPR